MRREITLPILPVLRMSGRLASTYEAFAGSPRAPLPPRSGSTLQAEWTPPEMSSELRGLLDLACPSQPSVPALAVKSEARDLLEALQPFGDPVPEAILTHWLEPVLKPVRNKQRIRSHDEIAAWFQACLAGVGHLETGAFTAATQRQAVDQVEFFPFVAQVYSVVAPSAVTLRLTIAILARIASSPIDE